MSEFYSLKATDNKGQPFDFAELKGKVVLVVNTASKCGLAPQYTGLQNLYDTYKDRGLVILGFPTNEFGGQEPGSDDQIAEFCQVNHGVTFPLMKKSEVNGDNVNDVYKYLKAQKSQLWMSRIKWNFEKFLVDKEGKVVSRWASTSSPDALKTDIEKLL